MLGLTRALSGHASPPLANSLAFKLSVRYLINHHSFACSLCAMSLVCPPAFSVCRLVLHGDLLLQKRLSFHQLCQSCLVAPFESRIRTSAVFQFRIFTLVVISYSWLFQHSSGAPACFENPASRFVSASAAYF